MRSGDGGGRDAAEGPAWIDSGSELLEGSSEGECCETAILKAGGFFLVRPRVDLVAFARPLPLPLPVPLPLDRA